MTNSEGSWSYTDSVARFAGSASELIAWHAHLINSGVDVVIASEWASTVDKIAWQFGILPSQLPPTLEIMTALHGPNYLAIGGGTKQDRRQRRATFAALVAWNDADLNPLCDRRHSPAESACPNPEEQP